MSNHVPPQNNLNEVFSRIQTLAFIVVVGGLLLLTLTSTLGEELTRTFVMSTLAILFILAGGLFGLVAMHHVSHTHLPEEADDVEAPSEQQPAPPLRRSRQPLGFLGMFTLGASESPDEPPRRPGQLRSSIARPPS